MKCISLLLAILTVSSVHASELQWTDFTNALEQRSFLEASVNNGLPWTVGDTSNYNLNAGFLKGTMTILVREETDEGFWLEQNVDMGFAGKQKIEALLDKNTGEVKKVLVNGQEQQQPASDFEVVSMEEANVTVPAGTFDCIHIVIRDKQTSKDSEAWVNPKLIPVNGMLKNISPSQLGKVTLELTSFQWAVKR